MNKFTYTDNDISGLIITKTMREMEKHPFKPFIPSNASSLIVGSFPGMEQVENTGNSEEWFYSASKNLFWPILSDAFSTELKTKAQKQAFLTAHKIAMADIFVEVRRKIDSNLDKHLTDFKYNNEIKLIIEKFKIKKLFFTSKFVEKHFLKNFPDISFGVCLPSPSQAASIPISKSDDYKLFRQTNPEGNTKNYRVFKYKQLLK